MVHAIFKHFRWKDELDTDKITERYAVDGVFAYMQFPDQIDFFWCLFDRWNCNTPFHVI